MQALFLTSNWVNVVGWALVHSLWQFAVVALVAGLLQRALRRQSATLRYGVLLVALAGMVLLPLATWLSLRGAEPVTPMVAAVEPGEQVSARPREEAALGRQISPPIVPLRPTNAAALETAPIAGTAWWLAAKERIQPYLAAIVGLWLAGVLVVALRPLLSWRTVRRLRREGVSPAGDAVLSLLLRCAQRLQIVRAVEVLQSTLVQAPVVVGYVRPVVLLPASVISGLAPSELEAILAHELAHIRRHDYLVNVVQTVVETLFFYHPAIWWLSREIRQERENCCDDLAMAALGSRADYGRALLAIEVLRSEPTALLLAAQGGSLLARMRRIAGLEPTPSFLGGGSLSGVLLVLTVLVAAVAWSAAVKTNAADAPNSPDAQTLLAAYEKTLVPYQRVKIKWTQRTMYLEKDESLAWKEEWTFLRDGDRGKSACIETAPSRHDKPLEYECLWQKGKWSVYLNIPTDSRDLEICYAAQPSEEQFVLRDTGSAAMHPASFGIFLRSIPDFLRTSSMSASREVRDGHAVEVLRGVSDEAELRLWLDPALGYVPRKIRCDYRHPTPKSSMDWIEYEVKRFEKKGDVSVPVEAIETRHSPAGQASYPALTMVIETKLGGVKFPPKFGDKDFQFSLPVPDGTRVRVIGEASKTRIHHEWRQGLVVKVVEPVVQGQFDPAKDARAEVAKRLTLAKRVKDRVLVLFGGNSWSRLTAFDEMLHSKPDTLLKLVDPQDIFAYQTVLADATSPQNRALAAEYGLKLDDRQSPALAILDADGRVLSTQDMAAFEKDGRYDADQFEAFLRQWEAPREDAEKVLQAALERAGKEQKKLWVVVSGAYCGTCYLLTDWLEHWQEVLGQDYLLVIINWGRMTHAEEAMARVKYPRDDRVGIPWFTILSPSGETLATSMGPKVNLGFPTEPEEIEQFRTILQKTATKITAEQVETLIADLRKGSK